MKPDMFLVSIITRREKLLPLKDALGDIGVRGLTVTPVEGCGTQLGIEKQYRGVRQTIKCLPKVLVEVVVCQVPVDAVIATATEVLRTGRIGDGKIAVERIDRVVRVRTGETDLEALTDPD